MAHLWTEDDAPIEYVALRLCRDVYHCLPSELKRERLDDIMAHLACLQIEADINAMTSKQV